MLVYAAPWCEIPTGKGERHFPEYPEPSLEKFLEESPGESLEEWHRRHGLP